MSTDEYVPSDEEMRRRHSLGVGSDGKKRVFLKYRDEWDRWLAAHDARVSRDAWQAGHTTGFEDALLACEIATGVKPGPPPGPTRNPHEETP